MPPSASADLSTRKATVLFRMSTLPVNSDDDSTRSRPTQHRGADDAPKEITRQRSIPDNKKRFRETHLSSTNLPDTKNITMWRHPIYTLQYFGMAVRASLPSQWPWSAHKTSAVALLFSVVFALHQQGKCGVFNNGDATSIQSVCIWLENVVLETLFWIGCGVLSTIGLGSGLQTGALFLFPHVCRLSLAWSKLHNHNHSNEAPSLAALLWSVAIPGFWSGTGSAVGELVPFLLARLIRKSGKDPFALLHQDPTPTPRVLDKHETSSTISSSESQESLSLVNSSSNSIADDADASQMSRKPSWTSQLLLSNTRAAMESQLSSNAFWKIFALAVVPNALFDLAGLVCGASSDVSMWEFFLATWLAKAIVRTPLQTCGLALAVVAIVSPSALRVGGDLAMQTRLSDPVVAQASSSRILITDFLERWGSAALSQFVGNDEVVGSHDNGSSAGGGPFMSTILDFVKMIWSLITAALFVFFVVSTIEQIAQHHVRSKAPLEQRKDKCHQISQ